MLVVLNGENMAGLLKCPDCGEIFDSVDSGNYQIALDEDDEFDDD